MHTKVSLLPFLLFFLLLAACDTGDRERPKDLPQLHPCALTVTQDGKPLEAANVALRPVAESRWGIGGVTDARGVAEIATGGFYPGVPEGKYKVTVKKTELTETEYISVVDTKFEDEAGTPLEIEIAKGKNQKTFEVGPAVRVVTGKVKKENE